MDKCPMCGYRETVQGQRVHTIMNEYVNKTDPKKTICVNNDANEFQSVDEEGVVKATWILKSVYEKGQEVVDVKKEEPIVIKNRLAELPPTPPVPPTNPFASADLKPAQSGPI